MKTFPSIKNVLKNPYPALFSVLLFFTPLIMTYNTNEIFEFPKMFFVYLVGFFIIFLFISDLILNHTKLRKPSPLVCLFFLLILVSTIFSSHFYTSFFGYYTRFNDGLLSYIVFFGLYIVAINKLNKEDLVKLTKIALLTIIPISVYGLSQFFGGPKFLWSSGSIGRVFSTLGQPNWLSQYLSFLLPLCVYFALTEDLKSFKIWFPVYVFGFYCFWVTYSMSGILSLLVGLLFLLAVSFKRKDYVESVRLRVLLIFSISFFICLSNLGIFGDRIRDVFTDVKKQVSTVKKVYAQGEEYKISDPGFIRFELWRSSFNLVKSSAKIFLIGSGPETFPYAFQPFRSGKLNYSSEWDFVFNKPHNYYLEVWSESGFFALTSYIGILYWAVKKSRWFLAPSVIALSVSNFFGWPTVSTSLLFWLFISGVEIIEYDESSVEEFSDRADKKKNKVKKVGERLVLVPIWGCYFLATLFLSEIYLADIYFNKSQELIREGYDEDALVYADKSIYLNSNEPNYFRGRAKINTVFLVYSQDQGAVKVSIFNDLQKAIDLGPNNLVTIRNSIPIYYFLAVEDVALGSGENNIDENYIDLATWFFNQTKGTFWNDVGVILAVAKYEKRLGLISEYETSVSRIEELRPDLLYWHELLR